MEQLAREHSEKRYAYLPNYRRRRNYEQQNPENGVRPREIKASRALLSGARWFLARWKWSIVCVATVLFAAIIPLIELGRPLWIDEANSILISRFGFSNLLERLWWDSHPPGYYVVLIPWLKVFGTSEYAIRGLSVILFWLSVFLIYRLGSALFSRFTGIISALIFAISPVATYHAQNGRPYTMVVCFTILSLSSLFLTFKGRPGALFSLVVLSLLGSFTHYWLIFLSGAVGLALLSQKKFLDAAFFGTSLIPFVLLWRTFLHHQVVTNSVNYLLPVKWWFFPYSLLDIYGGDKGALIYFGAITLSVWPLSKARWSQLRTLLLDRRVMTLGLVFGAGISAPLIASLIVSPVYTAKCTIVFLPCMALILGAMLGELASTYLAVLFSVALSLAAGFTFMRATARPLPYSDRDVVMALKADARPGDLIFGCGITYSLLDYYARQQKLDESIRYESFPLEVKGHAGWIDEEFYTPQLLQQRLSAAVDIVNQQKPGKVYVLAPKRSNSCQAFSNELSSRYGEPTIVNVIEGERHQNILVYATGSGNYYNLRNRSLN